MISTDAVLATAKHAYPEYRWHGGYSQVADVWVGYALRHVKRGRMYRTAYAQLNVEPWMPDTLVAAKLQQAAMVLDEQLNKMSLVGWEPV